MKLRKLCPWCSGQTVKSKITDRQSNIWRECGTCGGRYNATVRNDTERDELLESSAAAREGMVDAMKKTALDVWGLLNKVVWDKMTERGTFVDVGCSWGYLLHLAVVGNGWQGIGFEAAEFAHKKASSIIPSGEGPGRGIIHSGDMEEVPPYSRGDLVTCIEVIEHVENPAAFLDALMGLVKDDGVLFLSTPDADSLAASGMGSKWPGMSGEHIFLFSYKILEEALRQRGWEVFYADHVAFIAGFPGTLVLFARKMSEAGQPEKKPTKKVKKGK